MPKVYVDDDQNMKEEDKIALRIQKRREDTDRDIYRELTKICKKSVEQMTIEEKKFLKARSSYLTKAEVQEYQEIINADYSPEGATVKQIPLEELKRSDLELKASELGIVNPGDFKIFPNKTALIEEIKKYIK